MIQSGWEEVRQMMTLWDTIIQMNTGKMYGVSAHDLRSFSITKLTLEGVTPFTIYEITRHSIPGISDVVKIYTRPTIEEVRQAMELI